MRIQHNLSAMNAHRNLGANNARTSKNLEKLSSGFKINRAGDDAAGLAISEKMRAQISGLSMAQNNAHDGISLIQTAEGGLNETHSILQRMKTLATQSANGTYDNDVDRANIQKEVTALKSEIDRISDSTNYNGINLLDGSLGKASEIGGTDVTLELNNTAKAEGSYGFIDAVAGKYTLNVMTKISATASKPIEKGQKITLQLTIDNGSPETREVSLVAKDDKTLVAADGTEYATTTTGMTVDKMNDAFLAELKKTNLTDDFKIELTGSAATDQLQFTALDKGTDGAKIISSTIRDNLNKTEEKINSSGLDKTNTSSKAYSVAAENAYETIDVTKLAVWDGKDDGGFNDIEDAVFEVNGSKFLFAGKSVTDEQIAILAEQDITAVKTGAEAEASAAKASAAAVATTGDRKAMITAINNKTGINSETAATTVSDHAGKISLKSSDSAVVGANKGLTLQIGDTAEKFNKVTVSVGNMDANSIGIGGIDVSSQDGAASSIEKIKTAIDNVSSTRGDLGALQNRLEHTINNLSVTEENMTSAESRIRDVDMAKEMMDFTKNNILNQAAQSMLAQANQQPQGVLQLLQ